MTHRRALLTAGLLAWIALAGGRAAGAGSPIQTRTYDFKEAGKKMTYTLYVPTGYDKARKWPLIVALHGLNSSPQQIMGYPGMTRLAEKHGYVVVAPMGYNARGWYGSMGQKSRRFRPENLGELSEKDVMNVLALIRKEFSIDDDRIYLMGHSMGGGGTWHLGMKYPDIWAALGPIAPAIYRSPDGLKDIKHIPVILVQGDRDLLVPVRTARRWAAKMKELNMEHTYIEVAGGGHVRVAFDNLPKIFEFFNKHRKKPAAKIATIHEAARRGEKAAMARLLADGASVDAADEVGRTALHLVVAAGHGEVVRLLAVKGADLDARDKKDGATALHLAVRLGRKDMVELLLAGGASINATDAKGHTPLFYAKGDIAKLLRKLGGRTDGKQKDSKQQGRGAGRPLGPDMTPLSPPARAGASWAGAKPRGG